MEYIIFRVIVKGYHLLIKFNSLIKLEHYINLSYLPSIDQFNGISKIIAIIEVEINFVKEGNYFIYRVVTFLNNINLFSYDSYYL